MQPSKPGPDSGRVGPSPGANILFGVDGFWYLVFRLTGSLLSRMLVGQRFSCEPFALQGHLHKWPRGGHRW